MDQLANALAFANCTLLEGAIKKKLTTQDAATFDATQYNSTLLALSFFAVLVICLFVLYAFLRSARFRRQVQHEIQVLETTTPSSHIVVKDIDSENVIRKRYEVSFAFISYYVTVNVRKKAVDKQILHDVSGRFYPGRFTAILGASGSGKTTLLNIISDRVQVGKYSGYRMLNNERFTTRNYTTFMSCQGYVEQTDTFIETLTVHESLLYSAMLRLPDTMTLQAKIMRVRDVLKFVQLSDASNTKIGGLISGLKGLSGGQKRRLSIATELLRLPSILILDEPTSGLDATSSLLLINMLSTLAKEEKLTVVSTIHQPRAEIFKLFDDIVLMDKGGFLVYCGPSNQAVGYLQHAPTITIQANMYDNPADFIIDALGLDPEKEKEKRRARNSVVQVTTLPSKASIQESQASSRRYSITELFAGAAAGPEHHEDLVETTNLVSPLLNYWRASEANKDLMAYLSQNTKSTKTKMFEPKQSWLHVQTWTCFERRYSRVYHEKVAAILRNVQTVAIAFVIVTAFSYSPMKAIMNDPRIRSDDKLILREYGLLYQNVMLMFTISAYGMVLEYLLIIPEYFVERPLLLLERKSNAISYYSYVYACFMIETPTAVFSSVVLLSITILLHSWEDLSARAVLTLFLILILGTSAWQSLICFACSLSNSMPPVYGVVFLLLGSGLLFSGICVSYSDMWPFWYWCYYGNAPAVTVRSLIIACTTSPLQINMLQSSEMMNMSLSAMFVVLVATIVLGRLLAIVVYYLREYQSRKLQYISKKWIDDRLQSFSSKYKVNP